MPQPLKPPPVRPLCLVSFLVRGVDLGSFPCVNGCHYFRVGPLALESVETVRPVVFGIGSSRKFWSLKMRGIAECRSQLTCHRSSRVRDKPAVSLCLNPARNYHSLRLLLGGTRRWKSPGRSDRWNRVHTREHLFPNSWLTGQVSARRKPFRFCLGPRGLSSIPHLCWGTTPEARGPAAIPLYLTKNLPPFSKGTSSPGADSCGYQPDSKPRTCHPSDTETGGAGTEFSGSGSRAYPLGKTLPSRARLPVPSAPLKRPVDPWVGRSKCSKLEAAF